MPAADRDLICLRHKSQESHITETGIRQFPGQDRSYFFIEAGRYPVQNYPSDQMTGIVRQYTPDDADQSSARPACIDTQYYRDAAHKRYLIGRSLYPAHIRSVIYPHYTFYDSRTGA